MSSLLILVFVVGCVASGYGSPYWSPHDEGDYADQPATDSEDSKRMLLKRVELIMEQVMQLKFEILTLEVSAVSRKSELGKHSASGRWKSSLMGYPAFGVSNSDYLRGHAHFIHLPHSDSPDPDGKKDDPYLRFG